MHVLLRHPTGTSAPVVVVPEAARCEASITHSNTDN